jgi:hypothetical protein
VQILHDFTLRAACVSYIKMCKETQALRFDLDAANEKLSRSAEFVECFQVRSQE